MLSGFPGFGMRIVLAFFHCFGKVPLLEHLLYHAVRSSIELSSRFFRGLLVMRSEPGDDRLFRSCRAVHTSPISMSLSRWMVGRPRYGPWSTDGVVGTYLSWNVFHTVAASLSVVCRCRSLSRRSFLWDLVLVSSSRCFSKFHVLPLCIWLSTALHKSFHYWPQSVRLCSWIARLSSATFLWSLLFSLCFFHQFSMNFFASMRWASWWSTASVSTSVPISRVES